MTTNLSSLPLPSVAGQDPIRKTVRAIDLAPLSQSSPEAQGSASLLKDAHPLHQIRTQVHVCVGAAEITVGELVNAKDGQVLKLDRRVDQAVDLLIEGRVVARGQLVALDGQFAIRISELPQPLSLAKHG